MSNFGCLPGKAGGSPNGLAERFLQRAYDLCAVLSKYRIELARVIEQQSASRCDAYSDNDF
jgi:hypothetical protein